jgi:hypothetical protein
MTILSELVAHAFNVKLRVTVKGIRRKKLGSAACAALPNLLTG